MKTSPRPKSKPPAPPAPGKKQMPAPSANKGGMTQSPRPMPNPMNDRNSKRSIEQRTLRPMAKGGMCRGMGAAKKGGGSLSKNG